MVPGLNFDNLFRIFVTDKFKRNEMVADMALGNGVLPFELLWKIGRIQRMDDAIQGLSNINNRLTDLYAKEKNLFLDATELIYQTVKNMFMDFPALEHIDQNVDIDSDGNGIYSVTVAFNAYTPDTTDTSFEELDTDNRQQLDNLQEELEGLVRHFYGTLYYHPCDLFIFTKNTTLEQYQRAIDVR